MGPVRAPFKLRLGGVFRLLTRIGHQPERLPATLDFLTQRRNFAQDQFAAIYAGLRRDICV